MVKIKSAAIIILVVLCLVIMIQNVEMITIQFLFWTVTLSRVILLPLLAVTGFLAGYLFGKLGKRKERQQT